MKKISQRRHEICFAQKWYRSGIRYFQERLRTQIQQWNKCRVASTNNIGGVKICLGHHLLKFPVTMPEVYLRKAFAKTVVRAPIA